MSSRGFLRLGRGVRPGGCLVVEGAGFEAAVEDAGEAVGELAEGGVVAGSAGALAGGAGAGVGGAVGGGRWGGWRAGGGRRWGGLRGHADGRSRRVLRGRHGGR